MKSSRFIIVLSCIICFALTGCGKTQNISDVVQYESTFFLEFESENSASEPLVEVIDDMVYYSENGKELQRVDKNGETNCPIMELEEQDGKIIDICVSSREEILLLTQISLEDNAEYRLIASKEGRNEHICTLEIKEDFAVEESIVNDNMLCILTADENLLLFDFEGKLRNKLEKAGSNPTLCLMEGTVILGETDNEVVKLRMGNNVDSSWDKITELKICNNGLGASLLANKNNCYISDDVYVYQYFSDKKLTAPLFSWTDIGIDANVSPKQMLFSDGSLLLAFMEEHTGKVLLKKVVSNDGSTGDVKQNIVLAGVNPDDIIKEKVLEFNENSEEYRILVKDYGVYNDPYTKLRMDIIANETFDIMCLEELPIDVLIEKGMLVDLTEYMNLTEYVDSYIQAITVDNGIYQVSPFFAVYTLLGKEKEVGSELGWTYADFMSCLQENREITNNVTQYDLLRILCYRSLDDYIDWQNRTVQFENEEFKDRLQFIKDFECIPATQMPYYDKLRSGNIMLVEGYLRSGNDYRTYKYAFGEDISAKGYPCKNKNGNYMDLIAPLGISSSSMYKDIAWEFIEDVLGEETEYNYHDMGFPSRKATLEVLFEEWKGKGSLTMTLFGETEKVPYMSTSDAEDLERLIASANHLLKDYSEVELIIGEEISGFLCDQISMDVVLSNINNRVNLCLEEKN